MIAQFALRLICGMSLMWSLMPRNKVTAGFFRIQMLVVLGLSVLTTLTFGKFDVSDSAEELLTASTGRMVCAFIAVCAFAGSVMWTLGRRQAGTVIVFLIAMVSAATLVLSAAAGASLATVPGLLRAVSEVSAAALLGGAVTGMLLGHWYLTAPTMTIEPLSRVTLLFGAAALVRLFVSSTGLMLARHELFEASAVWGEIHWVWLGLRWGAGVIGPLAVFLMVWRILKYKNTQAATGVLFVGVILTFLGEMTASLLYQEFHHPL